MDDAGNTKDDLKLPLEEELAKEARLAPRAARSPHAQPAGGALTPPLPPRRADSVGL